MSGTVVHDAPGSSSGMGARRVVPTLGELLTADPEQFVARHTDIAAVNLACARGLPNCDETEFPKYLALLDTIADAVRRQTDKSWRLFKIKPQQFHHSEAVFRLYTMEHVFRVQFGIRYDPKVRDITQDRSKPWTTNDSNEIFIHGILGDKRTGTCSSLPTFAIAVGRRLGYPLKLVLVPNHTLYRWDDGKEILNFQHNEGGGGIRDDEYFKTWPRKWDEYDYEINERTKVWLHSLTPRNEVSKFLCNRALMLRDIGRYHEAIEALDAAARFDPINPAIVHIYHNVQYAMAGGDLSTLAGEDPHSTGGAVIAPVSQPAIQIPFHIGPMWTSISPRRSQPNGRSLDLDVKCREDLDLAEEYRRLVMLINESNRNRSPEHPQGNPPTEPLMWQLHRLLQSRKGR